MFMETFKCIENINTSATNKNTAKLTSEYCLQEFIKIKKILVLVFYKKKKFIYNNKSILLDFISTSRLYEFKFFAVALLYCNLQHVFFAILINWNGKR